MRGRSEGMSAGLAVVDAQLPPDSWITEEFDASGDPHYTISEFSKFFFARTAAWVRWRERLGAFILDGEYDDRQKIWTPTDKSETFGENRTDQDARYYTLRDVEGIAHSLAQKGIITGAQLSHTLHAISAQAKIFGHI